MRQELAGLEADLASCERCFGPERRFVVRFARPVERPRILLMGERPPRSLLQAEERLGLDNDDPGTLFLGQLIAEAGLPKDRVVLGAAAMCRPASRRLESAAGMTVCLRECAVHVRELVRLTEPRLLVPLGKAALRSLRYAFPERPEFQELRFPESVGRTIAVGGCWVHPVYHVTVRARLQRRDDAQRRDWRALGRVWQWIEAGELGPRPASLTTESATAHAT
ncbi:MAG: hypothetical protein U0167_12875 [bacterium]